MRIVGLHAVSMVDHYQVSVLASPRRMRNDSVRSDVHWRAHRRRQIHTGMHRSFAREWVGTTAEGTHQTAVDGPQAGTGVGLPLPGVHVKVGGNGCGLEEVVLLERLVIGRCQGLQLACGVNIVARLTLDSIGDGNLAGEHL